MSEPSQSNPQSSPEVQNAAVMEILQAVCPMEVDMLGFRAVESLIAGKRFKAVTSGRHLNLVDAASLVSCVAVIAQVALTVWNPWQTSGNDAKIEERVREAVDSHFAASPELRDVLAKQKEVLEQVVKALKHLRGRAQAH